MVFIVALSSNASAGYEAEKEEKKKEVNDTDANSEELPMELPDKSKEVPKDKKGKKSKAKVEEQKEDVAEYFPKQDDDPDSNYSKVFLIIGIILLLLIGAIFKNYL